MVIQKKKKERKKDICDNGWEKGCQIFEKFVLIALSKEKLHW